MEKTVFVTMVAFVIGFVFAYAAGKAANEVK